MRYGIISTGPISSAFARALALTDGASVTAVASRELHSAQRFIEEHGLGDAAAFDDVAALCASPEVDAVYIASPNSLHAPHALTAIDAGKHVVLEKPAVWNPAQWDQVFQAAHDANVLIFEAARHLYEPAQQYVLDELADRRPVSVRMNYSQYSSRWDAVLAGEEPNIFSLTHGGGALVDLGIYAIYDAVYWFGEPDSLKYFPTMAPTGVDAAGTLILSYEDFDAVITIAKNGHAETPSDIVFGREALRLSSVQGIDRVTRYSADNSTLLYESGARPGTRTMPELMLFEAEFFTTMFTAHSEGGLTTEQQTRYRDLTMLSRTVNDVCTKARQVAGIFFEGEAGGFTH